MNKMNKVMAWFFAALVLSSFAYAYEIVGDSVLYTGQYADLEVTPHTAYSPVNDFEQTFTVTNNVGAAGDLCVAYYFDKPLSKGNVKLKSVENYEEDEWISDISCTEVPVERNGTTTNETFCVDNGYSQIVQKQKTVWNDVTSFFTHISHNGKEYYYSNTPLSFAAYDEKSWKISYSPNPDDDSHKWGLLGWNSKSGNCYEDFISQNYDFLYDLDPWWNSTWGYSHAINITNDDNIAHDFEIVYVNTSAFAGTKCVNYTNSTRVVLNDTTLVDFEWYNSSKTSLYFIANFSVSASSSNTDLELYCDDDESMGEGNTSIFIWRDDFEDADVSDWSFGGQTGHGELMGVATANPIQGDYYMVAENTTVGGGWETIAYYVYGDLTGMVYATFYTKVEDVGQGVGHVRYQLRDGTERTDNAWNFIAQNNDKLLDWYDTTYKTTAFAWNYNVWQSHKLEMNVSSSLATWWINGTFANTSISPQGTVTALDGFSSYFYGYSNPELDYVFVGNNNMSIYLTPSDISIGAEEADVTSNESEARSTITSAINNVLTNPVIYTDMQIYARYYNGSQMLGRFDKVAVGGNQRWAFNYLTGSDTYTRMWNLTPVFYVLEMANLTSSQITVEVETLINNTET